MDIQNDIQALRTQCLKMGMSGIKGLAVLFRQMDKDFSQSLNLQEFKNGLQRYGLQLSSDTLTRIFKHLDKDGSGHVDFREFLRELRPPMSPQRAAVVEEVFNKLDGVKDGALKEDDLKKTYQKYAVKHPKYLKGEWTLDQVLRNFLDTYDTPGYEDGVVTRDEFLNYYSCVSSTIDDDGYFDMMMRACWGLPPRHSIRRK